VNVEDRLRAALESRAEVGRAFFEGHPPSARGVRQSVVWRVAAPLVGLGFVAAALWAALWVAGGRETRQVGQPTVLPPPSASVSSTPSEQPSVDTCSFPAFRPTFLPWDGDGQPPEPREVVEEGNAIFVWFSDEGEEHKAPYVSLVAQLEPVFGEAGDLDGFPTAEVRGTTGYLVWVGDPGVGELALTWFEGSGPCQSYSLHFRDPGLSQADAEATIERIARSLEEGS